MHHPPLPPPISANLRRIMNKTCPDDFHSCHWRVPWCVLLNSSAHLICVFISRKAYSNVYIWIWIFRQRILHVLAVLHIVVKHPRAVGKYCLHFSAKSHFRSSLSIPGLRIGLTEAHTHTSQFVWTISQHLTPVQILNNVPCVHKHTLTPNIDFTNSTQHTHTRMRV